MVEWPALSGSKPTTGKPRALSTFTLPPPHKEKKDWQMIEKWCSLMQRVLSCKNGVFYFEKGMFPFQQGCGIEKLPHSTRFFIIIVYNPLPPLKIPDRTLRNTPFQARTAPSLFFFSCRFLLDHTKPIESPPESLNRHEELII